MRKLTFQNGHTACSAWWDGSRSSSSQFNFLFTILLSWPVPRLTAGSAWRSIHAILLLNHQDICLFNFFFNGSPSVPTVNLWSLLIIIFLCGTRFWVPWIYRIIARTSFDFHHSCNKTFLNLSLSIFVLQVFATLEIPLVLLPYYVIYSRHCTVP